MDTVLQDTQSDAFTLENLRKYLPNMTKGTPVVEALGELLANIDKQEWSVRKVNDDYVFHSSLNAALRIGNTHITFANNGTSPRIDVILTKDLLYYILYYFKGGSTSLQSAIYSQYPNPNPSRYEKIEKYLAFEVNPKDSEPGASPIIVIEDRSTKEYSHVDFVPSEETRSHFRDIILEITTAFNSSPVILDGKIFPRTLKNRVKF